MLHIYFTHSSVKLLEVIMSPKKQRRSLHKGEQEALLQKFNDELENEDFLGNVFIGDEVEVGSQGENSDDSEVELPGEEVHVWCFDEEEEITIERGVPLPRKQKFTNLATVTDENNYDDLPAQGRLCVKNRWIYKVFSGGGCPNITVFRDAILVWIVLHQ